MNLNLSPESADRRWRLGCAAALAIYAIIGGIAGGLAYRFILDTRAGQEDKVAGPGEATV